MQEIKQAARMCKDWPSGLWPLVMKQPVHMRPLNMSANHRDSVLSVLLDV